MNESRYARKLRKNLSGHRFWAHNHGSHPRRALGSLPPRRNKQALRYYFIGSCMHACMKERKKASMQAGTDASKPA
jgi:hypothetical protein